MNTLQARLEAEYASNITRKKTLISQVRGLLDSEDSRKAIDEMKRLQSGWKSVGIVPHFQEQPLWEEFKKHCDAVYENSRRQYTAFVAGLEGNKDKALALCVAAEQLSEMSGAEILEGLKKVPQLREEFAAVGELPKDSSHDLNGRFQRALKQLEANVGRQRMLDQERGWNNLLEAGNRIRLYRLAMSENGDAVELEGVRQALRDFINGVQQWPKGGLQAVQHELTRTPSNDVALNEIALRTLCIAAEILTDATTPSEDQPLRRNYQVQRLMQGMGQGIKADAQQMDALVFEWITVGATGTAVYDALLSRFKHSRLKAQRLFH
jgi:hypothetical protein